LITIKDVAKECGVSIATVSRAFTADAVIKADTRRFVIETAERLGYRPNILARGLKNSRTQMVGMIIPSIDNHFYLDVLKYIECELHNHGYRLTVSFIQYGVYDEKDALATIEDSHVDVLIFSPRNTDNRDTIMRMNKNIQMLQLFTAPYNEIPGILMDDEYGTGIATEHLISRGYKRILYVGGDERIEGYYATLAKAGIAVDNSLVSLNWGITDDEAADLIKRTSPSAILGVARQAETAWRALTSLKKNTTIPFVAYDDVNWVKILDITAVSHPLEEIAQTVVNYIMKNETDVRKIIKPYLSERSSSK
jgi:Transcriptional regulators